MGNRLFPRTKIQGGSLKLPWFIAVNQQIMYNQTLCQQITRPINNISIKNRSRITIKPCINPSA